MQTTQAEAIARHRAETGLQLYDEIGFSGPPVAEVVGPVGGKISAVRHLGVRSEKIGRSDSWHPNGHVLCLNLSTGGHCLFTGDGRPDRRPLRRGDVGFSPMGHRTILDFPASNSALLVLLDDAALRRAVSPVSDKPFGRLYAMRSPRLAQLALIAEAELSNPGLASDIVLDGVMTAMAGLLVQHDPDVARREADRIHISPVRLQRVLDYVEANLSNEITLADLAAIAQLSTFHFTRVFKRQTGETPYRYVCARRVDRATNLLRQGDMPLTQLALACGFSSQAHFTAAFTKATGLSPGRYRRQFAAD